MKCEDKVVRFLHRSATVYVGETDRLYELSKDSTVSPERLKIARKLRGQLYQEMLDDVDLLSQLKAQGL
jgi:hypothetical protein